VPLVHVAVRLKVEALRRVAAKQRRGALARAQQRARHVFQLRGVKWQMMMRWGSGGRRGRGGVR
jgi:hypothetical protein